MKNSIFCVKENRKIADWTFLMKLEGDCAGTLPGQFVNIKLDGFYLRRPISVCDIEGDTLTIIYKAVGGGTELMSEMQPGVRLDLLTHLGNGFDLGKCGAGTLLIGGGVGAAPMYYLAKQLKSPAVALGFNSAKDAFLIDEFKALGCEVCVSTVDGSLGTKGFVTDLMKDIDYDYFCCCGPEAMLKAVYSASKTDGQFSFEERMGCGFGACMGCSCKTVTGYKRICKDGPVLEKGELLWKD